MVFGHLFTMYFGELLTHGSRRWMGNTCQGFCKNYLAIEEPIQSNQIPSAHCCLGPPQRTRTPPSAAEEEQQQQTPWPWL